MSCTANVKEVDPKYPQDIVPVLFDFSDYLIAGETIVTAVVTAKTESGVDPAPTAIINGIPMLNVLQPFHVVQWIKDGLVGVLYGLTCAATINTGEVLTLPCLIKVVSL